MTETLTAALPPDIERMATTLLRKAARRNVAIAAAESCTGGLLASLLTDVEGASRAFERGFVVYSEEAKCELLGVAAERIRDCGAVSAEVAIAMAEGALARSHADVAVAITGFAGRAGPGDESGLVHFACARLGHTTRHREAHLGDIGRGPVRIACLRIALEMLGEAMM